LKILDWRLAIATALVASACARPEQSLLEQFFGASRLRDTTALQRISDVVFEPRQDGMIRTFTITAVTPERIQQSRAVKEVTVEAPVILPDGRTVQKALVVTLQRAGNETGNSWRVVAFRDAAASPPPPRP
jgi:hypothetical protein